jgi:hypothetical protein
MREAEKRNMVLVGVWFGVMRTLYGRNNNCAGLNQRHVTSTSSGTTRVALR